MLITFLLFIFAVFATASAFGAEGEKKEKKSPAVDIPVVHIKSTLDGTDQPARFWVPDAAKIGANAPPVPLLVVLHTWSGDYRQERDAEFRECQKRGWVFIEPDFRGPNVRPEACGSDLAVQDVLDAVAYARKHARIDEKRIYAIGGSGGGHMALVMAHRAPELWAGISAWVPISDLAEWYTHCGAKHQGYAKQILAVCGGEPGDPKAAPEYYKRSPIHHLAKAKGVPIELAAGIHDGHTGSVPISHTLNAFNVLAEANGHPEKKLTSEEISYMVKERKIPPHLASEREDESGMQVLFRRKAGPVRVTIFEGGHTILGGIGVRWLAEQRKP